MEEGLAQTKPQAHLDVLNELHQLLHVRLQHLQLLQLLEDLLVGREGVLFGIVQLPEPHQRGVLPLRITLGNVDHTVLWLSGSCSAFLVI